MADEMLAPFGAILRQYRRAAGLTQEELADRAGLSARGIADLERGARHSPRRETVDLLVKALDLPPEAVADLLAAARRARVVVADPPATAATGSAQAQAEDTAPDAPDTQPRHNLPAQPTRLLGRADAVRAVVGLLRRADVRLVTLTGPGGIGKTRLAMQVAAELLDDFADGVWLARLARLTDPRLVIPTIAAALGLKEAGERSLSAMLRHHLRERRLLLALDNVEHVVDAAAEIAELLEISPGLTVLATSRMALRLRGEHEFPVAPLGAPAIATDPTLGSAPDRLLAYPAVALFVERGRAARPDFALTPANAAAVAQICARLDGLPLAIELAAARVKLLAPSALLARLEHGLGMLTGGARDLDERQQTMQSALAWSENLLSPTERILFRRLAVFAGGCTLDMAQAVCAAPEGIPSLDGDLFDLIAALVDQSLAQLRADGDEPRFSLLYVIREYAQERLAASGEADAVRRAHAAAMLALAERGEPELVGPNAGIWLDRLERDHDNVRAALRWARAQGEAETGLRLVAAVFRFWMARGHMREGRAWVADLLALEPLAGAEYDRIRARALFAGGVLCVYQMEHEGAETWLTEAIARGRAAGDEQTTASALSTVGVLALQQGNLARAQACLEESLALSRLQSAPRPLAVVLTNLGIVFYNLGDLTRAKDVFAQALATARELRDRDLIATNLANLATVAQRQGAIAASVEMGREALALYRDLGDPRRCAVGLEGLACSFAMLGQWERAARLMGAGAALRQSLGAPLPPSEQADLDQMIAPARAALGAERWTALFTVGQELTLAAAIAEALDGDDARDLS